MTLQQKAYQSVGWSGLSGMTSNGLELFKYVVLARILEPAEFGLLAMTMVIVGIGRIFADGGTSNAVIHYQTQTHRQLSTLYWVNIMAGSLLYLVLFITAPIFAAFFGEPEVTRILQHGGLILPLYAAGALYDVILRKSLSFRLIGISETIAALLGFSTAIILALYGYGVYALIWSYIVTAACLTILYIAFGIQKWKPSMQFHFHETLPYLKFGFYQMGERALNVYGSRVDQLIIGRFFGPEVLGAYLLAYQIILFPLLRLSPLLNRVAFPVFSIRKNDDALLRNGYLKLTNGVIAIYTPFFIVAGLTAPWLVPLLFGSGWELVAQLIPFFVIIGIIRMIGNQSGNIVLSKGRARLIFIWNLIVAVMNTAVIFIGAQFSIFVLLVLYTGISIVYFITGQWLLVHRLIGLTWNRFLRSVIPFAMSILIPGLFALFYRNLAVAIDMPDYLTGNTGMLISIATVFLLLYLPIIWVFHSGMIREFLNAIWKPDPVSHE